MKAFKAFIKPFETSQRTLKIKIKVNFFSLSGIGAGRFNSYLMLLGKRKLQKF